MSTSLYLGIAGCSRVSFFLPRPGAGSPPPVRRPRSVVRWAAPCAHCPLRCAALWALASLSSRQVRQELHACAHPYTCACVHVHTQVCTHIWTALINDELTPVLRFWSLPRVLCLPSFLHIHSCIVYGENPWALPVILEVFLISHSWLL